MFSIKNNVPDVYVRKSRDFQLMCNTYNTVQMATKFDIDSILNLTDTNLCNDSTLKLLQTKLGFFTNYEIMGEDLRTLLKSFPYLIHKKGTVTGIKQCIQLFFKIIDKTRATEVSVVNNSTEKTELNYFLTSQVYVVNIDILSNKFDITLLDEMLKYIIPAGYGVRYHFYTLNEFETAIFQQDIINIVFVSSMENSVRKVRTEDTELINNVNNSTILNTSTQHIEVYDEENNIINVGKTNYKYNEVLDVTDGGTDSE